MKFIMNINILNLSTLLICMNFLTAVLAAEENIPDRARTDQTIITLNYRVSVAARDRFIAELEEFSNSQGGYLVNKSAGSVVLRMPRSIGREAIDNKIKSIPGAQVFQASRQTKDVGIRLSDQKVRLKVASANLIKLRALARTAGLDDLLELEKALSRQLQEIENLHGEIRYLEEMSALITLQMQVHAGAVTSSPDKVPVPWIRSLTLERILKQ